MEYTSNSFTPLRTSPNPTRTTQGQARPGQIRDVKPTLRASAGAGNHLCDLGGLGGLGGLGLGGRFVGGRLTAERSIQDELSCACACVCACVLAQLDRIESNVMGEGKGKGKGKEEGWGQWMLIGYADAGDRHRLSDKEQLFVPISIPNLAARRRRS